MKLTVSLRPVCGALVCLMLGMTLCACASPAYRDDVKVADLMTQVQQAAPLSDGYRPVEADYLSASAFGDDLALIRQHVTDWAIALSDRSDSHSDQILIFHVSGQAAHVKAVADAVQRHKDTLQMRLGDYYRMYAPEELSKLENASVKVCGHYVLMTVLDERQTEAAQNAFVHALK